MHSFPSALDCRCDYLLQVPVLTSLQWWTIVWNGKLDKPFSFQVTVARIFYHSNGNKTKATISVWASFLFSPTCPWSFLCHLILWYGSLCSENMVPVLQLVTRMAHIGEAPWQASDSRAPLASGKQLCITTQSPSRLQSYHVFLHTSGWSWGWDSFPLGLVLGPWSLAESSSLALRSERRPFTQWSFKSIWLPCLGYHLLPGPGAAMTLYCILTFTSWIQKAHVTGTFPQAPE